MKHGRPVGCVLSLVIVLHVAPARLGATVVTAEETKTGVSPSSRAKPSHALVLIWLDPQGLVSRQFDVLADEVVSVFGSMGVGIQWKRSSLEEAGRQPGEIVILLVPRGPAGWRARGHVMGATTPGDAPVIRAYYRNVARTLGEDDSRQPKMLPASERIQMARALGRVIAHEIIHAIAPPHPHARWGIFNHRLTRRDLTGRHLRLDPNCSAAFETALKGAGEARERHRARDEKHRRPVKGDSSRRPAAR